MCRVQVAAPFDDVIVSQYMGLDSMFGPSSLTMKIGYFFKKI
jgi:hypothetical protein